MLDVQYVLFMWVLVVLSAIMACWLLTIVYYDGKEWAGRVAGTLFAFALTVFGTIFSDSWQMAGTIALVVGLCLCLALSAGLVQLARKRAVVIKARAAEATAEQ